LRETAADMARNAVASARQGDGDLVPALASVGTLLMCRLLGVPDADVPIFTRWADALSPIFGVMTPEQIAAASDAIPQLLGYVDGLTGRRADTPGPDLISALLAAEADGERLSHDETVTMIANLLIGGHDTTGSQIPCAAMVALQHRDELVAAAADPNRFSDAVAETMRLQPSIPLSPRTAVAPIELYGREIPVGSMVFLCTAAAGRDASAWSEPDEFMPDRCARPDTPKPLNFGAGAHYCLGTALAKIAVEECVRAVICSDPPLRLAEEAQDIPWRVILGRSPSRLLVHSG
jgi:cytochrome P450